MGHEVNTRFGALGTLAGTLAGTFVGTFGHPRILAFGQPAQGPHWVKSRKTRVRPKDLAGNVRGGTEVRTYEGSSPEGQGSMPRRTEIRWVSSREARRDGPVELPRD